METGAPVRIEPPRATEPHGPSEPPTATAALPPSPQAPLAPPAAPAAPAEMEASAPAEPAPRTRLVKTGGDAFEPLAPAETLGLDPEVHAFVANWLEAAANGDLAEYRALGFPVSDEEFEATYMRWEDFLVTRAVVERSSVGRIYLRVVLSYAFHDAR